MEWRRWPSRVARPCPSGRCSPTRWSTPTSRRSSPCSTSSPATAGYLADPYRPTRSRGMEDNDPGGFAPEIQAEIRAAAVDAVLAWAAGRPPAVPAPTGDALLELIDARRR